MLVSNNHNPLPKTKYSLWRLIYILVLGLLAATILLTSYFIYQTIYIGIANANAIVASETALSMYNLDIVSYEKNLALINQKKQLGGFPANSRNIFIYSKNSSTYEVSTTPR